MTKAELMQCLEEIANAEFSGHFAVMKFSCNWRVSFGTPMKAHSIEPGDKDHEMCEGKTFEEAAIAAIRERRDAIPSQFASRLYAPHQQPLCRSQAGAAFRSSVHRPAQLRPPRD